MGSNISWTDETWNPTTGCSRVSPGCEHCYAEALSLRRGWSKLPWTKQNAAENVVLHPERLEQPLHWGKPRKVFVNSMSDLFHEQIPDDFIDKVFAVMALSLPHTFQVLTKRHNRMRDYVSGLASDYDRLEAAARKVGYTIRYDGIPLVRWPIPGVWLGVSVENQRRADERIPVLLKTPAAVRWVSVEPLLGPVSFRWPSWHHVSRTRDTNHLDGLRDLDWIVVGGESGPGHRPMKIEWLESIVEQCQEANVPVFVKQASAPLPGQQGEIPDDLWALKEFPEAAQ